MARHDDALPLSEMLAGATGEGIKDLLREVVRDALQELIEEELTATSGAAKHERTEARTAQRNGGRDRLVSTPAGDVELKIPKLRKGSFFPELLEPRRRVDRALWAVIMTAYITGTSTRKVDDLVRALGCDSGVSKSTVSRICAEIDTDSCYRAMDFLLETLPELQETVFFTVADLLQLDVDLLFFDYPANPGSGSALVSAA